MSASASPRRGAEGDGVGEWLGGRGTEGSTVGGMEVASDFEMTMTPMTLRMGGEFSLLSLIYVQMVAHLSTTLLSLLTVNDSTPTQEPTAKVKKPEEG